MSRRPGSALVLLALLTSASLSIACTSSEGDKPSASGSGGSAGTGGGASSGGSAQAGTSGSGGTQSSTGGSNPLGGTGSGGSGTGGGGTGGSAEITEWNQANLTHYESYPDPGSEECIEYNGCEWAGQFAALDEKQTEQWVMDHNILAVHEKDFEEYKLKTLRLRMGDKTIDAVVYDMCADSDCDGCCTANSAETGFLIDIEKYTMQRFGEGDGVVEWACVDCN